MLYYIYTIDTRVIQRMISNGNIKSDSSEDKIILFVRLEGEPYACLGPLKYKSYNINHAPVIFLWEILYYDQLQSMEYFKNIVNKS